MTLVMAVLKTLVLAFGAIFVIIRKGYEYEKERQKVK